MEPRNTSLTAPVSAPAVPMSTPKKVGTVLLGTATVTAVGALVFLSVTTSVTVSAVALYILFGAATVGCVLTTLACCAWQHRRTIIAVPVPPSPDQAENIRQIAKGKGAGPRQNTESYASQLHEANNSIGRAQSRIAELERQLEAHKETAANASKTVADLQQQHITTTGALELVRTDAKTANENREELARKLRAAEEKLTAIEKEQQEKQREIKQLREEITKHQHTIAGLRREASNQQQAAQKHQQEWDELNKNYREAVEDAISKGREVKRLVAETASKQERYPLDQVKAKTEAEAILVSFEEQVKTVSYVEAPKPETSGFQLVLSPRVRPGGRSAPSTPKSGEIDATSKVKEAAESEEVAQTKKTEDAAPIPKQRIALNEAMHMLIVKESLNQNRVNKHVKEGGDIDRDKKLLANHKRIFEHLSLYKNSSDEAVKNIATMLLPFERCVALTNKINFDVLTLINKVSDQDVRKKLTERLNHVVIRVTTVKHAIREEMAVFAEKWGSASIIKQIYGSVVQELEKIVDASNDRLVALKVYLSDARSNLADQYNPIIKTFSEYSEAIQLRLTELNKQINNESQKQTNANAKVKPSSAKSPTKQSEAERAKGEKESLSSVHAFFMGSVVAMQQELGIVPITPIAGAAKAESETSTLTT